MPGNFLSSKLFPWDDTVRFTAVEVKNEKRHHDQDQTNCYPLEYVLEHIVLEYTGIFC